jgi:hypothetical protein
VQQVVEELLREASDEDFREPTFADLKRQFQEAINGALGERVIAEVIMTQVSVEQARPQSSRETEQDLATTPGVQTGTAWAPMENDPEDAAPFGPDPARHSVSVPSVD